MIKDVKKTSHWGLSSLLIAIILTGFILLYNLYINEKIEHLTDLTLDEIITQQSFHFKSKFETSKEMLQSIAKVISTSNDISTIDMKLLNELSQKSSFDYITVIDKKGNGIYKVGEYVELANRKYFNQALKGETVISEPLISKINGEEIIIVATPIIFENEIYGVLTGAQSVEKLGELFSPSFERNGFAYVVDNDGKIILKSESQNIINTSNILDVLNNATFLSQSDLDTFKNNLYDDESGSLKYKFKGENYILKYIAIGLNGWNIISIIPSNVVTNNANEITIYTAILSVFCIAIIFLYMLRVYILQSRNIANISQIAYVDELTKAPTLAKFKLEVLRFIKENPNKKLLMVKFDIEKFKLINEILGSQVGDKVLINIAKALKADLPENYDCYAHLYNDEFLILYTYDGSQSVRELKEKFRKNFYNLMGDDFKYNIKLVSGYYYMFVEDCTDVDEAIEKANIAHRRAKETCIDLIMYDKAFIEEDLKKKEIENRMQASLKNGDFKVYLQPQYLLSNEQVIGAEALVRWEMSSEKLTFPDEFIPIFEQNGFIIKLDLYMFEEVCKTIRKWIDNGYVPIPISVNFSRLHLNNIDFVSTLCKIADKYQVPHSLLGVELTESIIFDNEEQLIGIMNEMRIHGFTLLMDDFGSGYSSLGLLKNIPVDVIKIDKSFFDKDYNQERSQKILLNVIRLAKDLKIQTVAEGVETKEYINMLRNINCDTVQGYYYEKPISEKQFILYLNKNITTK